MVQGLRMLRELSGILDKKRPYEMYEVDVWVVVIQMWPVDSFVEKRAEARCITTHHGDRVQCP